MVKLVVNSVCAIKMQSGSRIGAGSRSPHSFYSQFSFQEEDGNEWEDVGGVIEARRAEEAEEVL